MRKILNLRPYDTFHWVDNWHPIAPLNQKYSEQLGFIRGRFLSAKVSTIHQGVCRWPRPRISLLKLPHLSFLILMSVILYCGLCIPLVSSIKSLPGMHSELLLLKDQWASVVWYPNNVPRWAIIEWIAVLQRPFSARVCIYFYRRMRPLTLPEEIAWTQQHGNVKQLKHGVSNYQWLQSYTICGWKEIEESFKVVRKSRRLFTEPSLRLELASPHGQ